MIAHLKMGGNMKKIGLVVIAVMLVFFASDTRAAEMSKFKGSFLQSGYDVYELCRATSINVNAAETWDGGNGKPATTAGMYVFLSQYDFCAPAWARSIEGFCTLAGGLETKGLNSVQINQVVEAYDYLANRTVVLDVHLRWEAADAVSNGNSFYRDGALKIHYSGSSKEANLSGYVAIPEEGEVYLVGDMSWGNMGEAKSGEMIKE
jgi:hypothetical protein